VVLDETKVGRGIGDAVPCANFHSDYVTHSIFIEAALGISDFPWDQG
jgi:hypothetical protein